MSTPNWFSTGGANYSKFRPEYPKELSLALAALGRSEVAVDVGCGNGQLTKDLAQHFNQVIGIDPSPSQIENAERLANIKYQVGSAENLFIEDGVADIVTVAQAAHWFDLPSFYKEVRRISRPDGFIALISYGVMTIKGPVCERFKYFYDHEIERFWPPERRYVEEEYKTIEFPFADIEFPVFEIRKNLNRDEFLGLISTWSATKALRELGQEEILSAFEADIVRLWPNAEVQFENVWPIATRVAKVNP